jgi:hypothetical protein
LDKKILFFDRRAWHFLLLMYRPIRIEIPSVLKSDNSILDFKREQTRKDQLKDVVLIPPFGEREYRAHHWLDDLYTNAAGRSAK